MRLRLLIVVTLVLSVPAVHAAKDASVDADRAFAGVPEKVVTVKCNANGSSKDLLADGQDTQSWWQHLIVTVITTTGAIAIPVLSTLLVILVRRWNIQIEYEKVEWVGNKAKNFAEQKARNALKDGKPLDAPEVARIALTKGRELAQGKLAPWAAGLLADVIEAKVGEDNKGRPATPSENLG